jgi:type III pantothenate kinase
MWLAIDIGNTHTVLGCFEGKEILKKWRLSTHSFATADEFTIKLDSLLRRDFPSFFENASSGKRRSFKKVILSSVVPSASSFLKEAFQDDTLHIIHPETPFAFKIKANPASQVGADRLVNAEAAFRLYGSPAIILDSGTATTLCALSAQGEYLGGAILPGLELSVEALAKKAAQLFRIELTPPPHAIGSNTKEALQSGILFGYASMLDGMIQRFKDELEEPHANVIATGGVSTLLKGLLSEVDVYDPDLTLKGLAEIYDSLPH